MEFIIGAGALILIISMIPVIRRLINIGVKRLEHDEEIRYGEACYRADVEHQKRETEKKED